MDSWSFQEWTFTAKNGDLVDGIFLKQAALPFPEPTMLFDSFVTVQYQSRIVFSFSSLDLLASVRREPPEDIKVDTLAKDYWKSIQHLPVKRYDWTFEPDMAKLFEHDSSGGSIDQQLLADTDMPILHFISIDFYEDELADNGKAKADFKLRVMPWGFYGLLQYFLRVDRVALKSVHLRIYHVFDTHQITYELKYSLDRFQDDGKSSVCQTNTSTICSKHML